MLELKDICKEYKTGDTVQKALDHVNLTLADTEFVAILGPSGSGKTTLLNIIGGLDQYDSGDLIIDGISTSHYTSRNWDAYRNHAVGFVFQNYNLIGHLSILANVELALTLSGVSREGRKKRAEDVLRQVGLGDHLRKKPSQLSGGQMQRVAIARALVNNPRIILADEPTGALDSNTSIQVMDMLKEISHDRLVVMVTHNPELAEQYATRIVTIRDGQIAGSRDLEHTLIPETPSTGHSITGAASSKSNSTASAGKSTEDRLPENSGKISSDGIKSASADTAGKIGARPKTDRNSDVSGGRFHRTSMSFLTALSLSFQNLRTKKARTFMVAFAGSIGIIGIALILAIETGLQQYIRATETATLSQYPIEIYATGIDWSSILTQGYSDLFSTGDAGADNGSDTVSDSSGSNGSGEITVNPLAKNIFTGINSNDLISFKKYLESDDSEISDYATDIEYSYGIEPQIYTIEDTGEIEQLNPNRMLSDMLTSIIDVSSLMDGFVGESLFHAMPSDPSLYEDSYAVKAGRWPENNHELVLVLTDDGRISDFLLYELGIKDPEELRQMIEQFSTGSDTSVLNLARNAASAIGADDSEDAKDASDESDSSSKDNSNAEAADSAADSSSVISSSTGNGAEGTSADQSAAESGTSAVSADSSEDTAETCSYSDFLDRKFKLILSSDTYVYDDQMNVWSSQSDNADYMNNLVKNGEDLTIVGIVQAKNGASNRMLTSGIAYPRGLINDIIAQEKTSEPVKAQLASPDTDIFTGRKFTDPDTNDFDLKNMVSLDQNDVAKAFHVNSDAASSDTFQNYLASEIDDISNQIIQYASAEANAEMSSISLSDFIDVNDLKKQLPQLTEKDLMKVLDAASSSLSKDVVKTTIQELGNGYADYLKSQLQDPETRDTYKNSLEKMFRPVADYIDTYLKTEDAQNVIGKQVLEMFRQNMKEITPEKIKELLQQEIQAFLEWVKENNASLNENGGQDGQGEQLSPDNPVLAQLYLASEYGKERITALATSLAGQTVNISTDQFRQLADALAQSFNDYATENALPDLSQLSQDLTAQLIDSLTGYLTSGDAQAVIGNVISEVITSGNLQRAVSNAVEEKLTGIAEKAGPEIISRITDTAQKKLLSFANNTAGQAKRIVLAAISKDYPQIADYINRNMSDFFTVNQDLFRQAIKVNASTAELQSILTSFLNSDEATYAGNLSKLGYADLDSPTEIMIYPSDFDAKNEIASLITDYNDNMKASGNDDKVISYSDVVAAMMQSIIDIINAVSRILMAFVSISLIVSSIMIGVITYISVLERRKEIGILRAIGASRLNIREVFNAETVITGFLSGCLGVGIACALVPLANMIIRQRTGQPISASLPPLMAAALVLLSVVLTLLAGLIPAGQASRSDPVKALRSE